MKKFAIVFMSMFLMLLGIANVAKAGVNEPKDFVGKWTATIVGLPDGDLTMTVDLKLDGDKLVGTYTAKELGTAEFDQIAAKGKLATFYFNASGYDVSMTFELKDANTGVGDMMEMFDVKWKRVTE